MTYRKRISQKFQVKNCPLKEEIKDSSQCLDFFFCILNIPVLHSYSFSWSKMRDFKKWKLGSIVEEPDETLRPLSPEKCM